MFALVGLVFRFVNLDGYLMLARQFATAAVLVFLGVSLIPFFRRINSRRFRVIIALGAVLVFCWRVVDTIYRSPVLSRQLNRILEDTRDAGCGELREPKFKLIKFNSPMFHTFSRKGSWLTIVEAKCDDPSPLFWLTPSQTLNVSTFTMRQPVCCPKSSQPSHQLMKIVIFNALST